MLSAQQLNSPFVREASARISGLQKTLDQVTAANSDMKRIAESEADLRKSYTLCQERLATYERVYGSGSGSGSNVPSEPGKLVELVAKKEEEIRALKSLKRQEDERVSIPTCGLGSFLKALSRPTAQSPPWMTFVAKLRT